jgi:hypothetical protein
LLEGDAPHPVTLRAIADARLLLRTTLFDGDALSVREALQLGTPVIATENGMRPHGVRTIPVRDQAALELAILAELQSGGRRGPMEPNDEPLKDVFALYESLILKSTIGERTS